jgi:hypothetical protein
MSLSVNSGCLFFAMAEQLDSELFITSEIFLLRFPFFPSEWCDPENP